jgi:hypothetical protein
MPYAGGLLKVMPGDDLSSLAYRIETFLSEDHNSSLDSYEERKKYDSKLWLNRMDLHDREKGEIYPYYILTQLI